MLAGKLSQERGWGVKGDTFYCLQAMGQLGQPIWFHTGDRDVATHIFRSKLLSDGKTLSEVTAEIAGRLGIKSRILPMSNSRVETRVGTAVGRAGFSKSISVERWYQDPVESIRYAGASDAEPAPGVIDAIRRSEAVILAPSNQFRASRRSWRCRNPRSSARAAPASRRSARLSQARQSRDPRGF
jgi:LPPG:FO 2-phospho-L-lactate transferase